jgi:hypothetical protein
MFSADPKSAHPDLLSMNSKHMDNRLNALRVKQRNRTDDTLGFPPLCDELGLAPVECVEQMVCPLYENHAEALLLAGASVREIMTAPDRSCAGRIQMGSENYHL